MSRLEEAQRALAEYENYLRSSLNILEGEDWQARLPETGVGDRMFKKWQELAVSVRRAEERGQ